MSKEKVSRLPDVDVCEVPRWKRLKSLLSNLAWEDFTQRCQDDNGVLLDVRTQEEFETDHLPNAINISYLSTDLVEQLEQLDPQVSYYVYCRTSRRSVRVCTLMKNMGFSNVYHLKDGLIGKVIDG